jgi:hypothetical protein
MSETFSGVWYAEKRMMKYIKIQTIEKESIL